ncbi:MAG: DUF4097 family beta strand repeat protein [Planctomycetota bacterium]|nr:MAG: DUF4097 family beta strand repeat protein [Planctomycetota bacterium]
MRSYHITQIMLGCLLCLVAVTTGCCIQIGCLGRAKYERTERLSAPMEAGGTIDVETSYGWITVSGGDVKECRVTAEICAQAPSEEEAQELAEQVKIEIETLGKTMKIRAKKPRLKNNRSISVDFDITVPKETSVECESSYGSIKVVDIEGDVKGYTSYGSINTNNTNGSVDLDTSYGGIHCEAITSDDIRAGSSYGSIDIACSGLCPADVVAKVRTSYGSIDFGVPAGFAGEVEMSTSYGSIKTELPITMTGELSKKRIKGTVGKGEGRLELKTSYGSIKIR